MTCSDIEKSLQNQIASLRSEGYEFTENELSYIREKLLCGEAFEDIVKEIISHE